MCTTYCEGEGGRELGGGGGCVCVCVCVCEYMLFRTVWQGHTNLTLMLSVVLKWKRERGVGEREENGFLMPSRPWRSYLGETHYQNTTQRETERKREMLLLIILIIHTETYIIYIYKTDVSEYIYIIYKYNAWNN